MWEEILKELPQSVDDLITTYSLSLLDMPIEQMGQLRLREYETTAQGHTASAW